VRTSLLEGKRTTLQTNDPKNIQRKKGIQKQNMRDRGKEVEWHYKGGGQRRGKKPKNSTCPETGSKKKCQEGSIIVQSHKGGEGSPEGGE